MHTINNWSHLHILLVCPHKLNTHKQATYSIETLSCKAGSICPTLHCSCVKIRQTGHFSYRVNTQSPTLSQTLYTHEEFGKEPFCVRNLCRDNQPYWCGELCCWWAFSGSFELGDVISILCEGQYTQKTKQKTNNSTIDVGPGFNIHLIQ